MIIASTANKLSLIENYNKNKMSKIVEYCLIAIEVLTAFVVILCLEPLEHFSFLS